MMKNEDGTEVRRYYCVMCEEILTTIDSRWNHHKPIFIYGNSRIFKTKNLSKAEGFPYRYIEAVVCSIKCKEDYLISKIFKEK